MTTIERPSSNPFLAGNLAHPDGVQTVGTRMQCIVFLFS